MDILNTVRGWFSTNEVGAPAVAGDTMISIGEAARWLHANAVTSEGVPFSEAFTQADIELALDDRGWLVGGKRMAGELDPLSRQVQVNRSRYYWLRDPLVKQAVRLWTDYAFGSEAVTWSCDDQAIQKKLDTFMHDRRNRRITSRAGMRRMSQRLLVDGEIFFAIYTDGTIRFFDCLQITDILTDPDDEDTVVAYKRVTSGKYGAQPKTLYYKPWDYEGDAAEGAGEQQPYYSPDPSTKQPITYEKDCVMYHLAFDSFEKRGTTLMSACSDWSREHRRFMTARVAITEALSKFAFKGSVKGGQKMINTIRAKMESTFAQTGLSGGTEHQPPNAPGGTWLQNEGISLEAMPRVTGANEAKADADGLKLMVSAGTGIMLHYFGDPSTGNLATATAMELPMLKMFGAYQQLWKDAWRDLFAIVLDESPDDERAIVAIEMPAIIEDDLQKLGTFITQLTTVFPEAKVPQVLEMCLTSMGVQNVNEVMDVVAAQRKQIDQQNAQNREDTLAGKKVALDQKTGKPIVKDAGAPGGANIAGAVGSLGTDASEAALLDKLNQLLEALR
jgi:hypothetical protein